MAPRIDLRVIPVRYDELEVRYREPRDCLMMYEFSAFPDFPISGPRSTLWCCQHMVTISGSARAWHNHWKIICKLTPNDGGVDSHFLCCEFIHHLMVYDQGNLANLAAAECAAREIQTQEIRYAERVTGSNDDSTERHILAGSTSLGNLCIMPAIREFLSAELKVKNDINKERRKAREERGLSRPDKEKNKKGKKEGDA